MTPWDVRHGEIYRGTGPGGIIFGLVDGSFGNAISGLRKSEVY